MIKEYSGQKNDIIALWNASVASGEVVFKPMTEQKFDSFFIEEKNCKKVLFVAVEGDMTVGCSAGCYDLDSGRIFISYINVKKEYRNKGIGKELLKATEETLKSFDKANADKNVDIIFYNPMQIEWFIAGTPGHDHPCAPGVDMDSYAYTFFKNNGYNDYAEQLSFYLELTNYVFPQKVVEGTEKLKERGIEIGYFDKDKHYGFSEFFDALKNEGWRKAVLSSLDKKIVVASDHGKICGYTGPLSVQQSGRGGFHGIGVHPDYRGLGIGTILFANLCKGLGEMGATFMSLYTGSVNPARFIYGGAGFKVVKHWADMKKPSENK